VSTPSPTISCDERWGGDGEEKRKSEDGGYHAFDLQELAVLVVQLLTLSHSLISKSKADAATMPVPSVAATSALSVPTSTDSVAENTASATQAEATAAFTGAASHMVAPVGGLAAVLLGLAGLL
jgi:hypothetical protein